MKYILNGRGISRREFLRTFQGMVSWIDAQVKESIFENKTTIHFNTGKGPLVISAE